MSTRERAVSVHQVPMQVSSASQAELLRRLKMSSENGHARLVLDCSMVHTMDSGVIELLLDCLEEVMMHNGDLRLATLDPEIQAMLHQMGGDKLFEIYPTAERAVQSYQLGPIEVSPDVYSNYGSGSGSNYVS